MSAARRKVVSLPLIALALWGATFALEIPMAASARGSRWMAARRAQGSPAAAQVAGSFRVVGANALWLKVNAYHHDWERRGKDWTKNKDLLPLLRAVTYLDPHFIDAYAVHSLMLSRQGKLRESEALLQEGIRNNPNRHELYESLGLLYAWNLKRPAEAIPCYARALALAPDDFARERLARTLRILTSEAEKHPRPPAADSAGRT